ncbi:retrovirus-related pol polyprotein from transposon TNT 1-94 [Tanacetum coccineum]
MRENNKEEKVKQEMDEIETINIELEHKHCDSLIAQLNSKSMENADLKGQIQEKVFVTTTLQNELRRLKGKLALDNATTITNAIAIAPGMFKLDIEPLSHRLNNNRDAHENYLKKIIENTDTIRGLVVQIVLWYLDFECSKHMTGNRSQLMNFVSKFLGTIRFRNNQIAKIMGYGDYQLGNLTILRVYYVEGLRHKLFSVGQFCDSDLDVTFRKNTCFIQNLDGVDLLSGSIDTNLYMISFDDMLKTSPICLLSKASNTKSWLWHRQLSHLNFGTLNKLAKDGLDGGILMVKNFRKIILCSAVH